MDDAAFRAEVAQAVEFYEQAIRRPATRTRQMIELHGEEQALSRLMISPDLQEGFKVLRDRDQLDQTFEAIVVHFPHRFTAGVVEAAQWRLDNPHSLL
jgi:hypothetical protein